MKIEVGDVVIVEHRHPSGYAVEQQVRVLSLLRPDRGPLAGKTRALWTSDEPGPRKPGHVSAATFIVGGTGRSFGTFYVRHVSHATPAPVVDLAERRLARAGAR